MLSALGSKPKRQAEIGANIAKVSPWLIAIEAMMKIVDFYFDYSSTNSYFAAFLLPDICRKHEATVRWRPMHLASMFRGTGFDVMSMPPRKARYLWRDASG